MVRGPARGRPEIPSASAPFRLCTLENVKRISRIGVKKWTNDGVGYDVRELLHKNITSKQSKLATGAPVQSVMD